MVFCFLFVWLFRIYNVLILLQVIIPYLYAVSFDWVLVYFFVYFGNCVWYKMLWLLYKTLCNKYYQKCFMSWNRFALIKCANPHRWNIYVNLVRMERNVGGKFLAMEKRLFGYGVVWFIAGKDNYVHREILQNVLSSDYAHFGMSFKYIIAMT